MFSSWQGKVGYLTFSALALALTAVLTRPGFERSLTRPITPGFGPPCTLWQAWKVFCGFFWEQMLLVGVVVSGAIRVSLAKWQWVDALVALWVAAVFPFVEYMAHRFLLHRSPQNSINRKRESLAVLVHRVHHRDPWHTDRAINPPLSVVFYAVGLPILFFPFLSPPRAMTGVAVSWAAILWYEWVHFLIHTSHVPRNRLFARIWRNHRMHHFKNEHFWFNVSTFGVDSILGTRPDPGSVPASPSCLNFDETANNPIGSDPPAPSNARGREKVPS